MVEMPILLITLSTPLPAALTYLCTASTGLEPGQVAGGDEVLDALEGQVGVDRRGAVADEQRHVVHLAGVTGLDDQADPGAGLLPDEVVVHRRGEQQRRDGRHVLGRVAVGQHDEPGAGGDRGRHLAADPVQRVAQRLSPAVDRVEAVHRHGGEAGQVAVVVDVQDLGQLVVVDDRVGQEHLPAGGGGGLQQVLLGPKVRPRLVTSSSRMASSGGLVTWANSCPK
jgi:hypothetical protein